MANTTRDTVKMLSKNIITRLENQKAITLSSEDRQGVWEEVVTVIGPAILTEEDLRMQSLERIGASKDQLENTELTESAQYKAAKSMVRKSFGDDELHGLYFQKTLKSIAQDIGVYLMESKKIEEVYETDDRLERMIVDLIKKFKPANIH